jgi:hypothetical protein
MNSQKIVSSIWLAVGLTFLCSIIVSCEPAAKSASQAFDNANSVIKSGSETLFMEPEVTPTPVAPSRY